MMKKDMRIALIRVVAMCSIVLCHIVQEYKSVSFMGQFFNVGVFIFIFMSAFLYGRKEIYHIGEWLLKRATRLYIPVYIYMIALLVMQLSVNDVINLKQYGLYVIGVQGFFSAVQGAAHLWFITAIVICYLITPILYKLKAYVQTQRLAQLCTIFVMLMLTQVIISYSLGTLPGRYMCYINLYILGYYLSFLYECKLNKKAICWLTFAMAIAVILRVVSRKYIDGSIFYSNIIVLYSQSMLAIWTYLMLYRLDLVYTKFQGVIIYLDSISFEIYIVHYIFVTGKYSLMHLTRYAIVNILLVIIATCVSALLLHYVSNSIKKIRYKETRTILER